MLHLELFGNNPKIFNPIKNRIPSSIIIALATAFFLKGAKDWVGLTCLIAMWVLYRMAVQFVREEKQKPPPSSPVSIISFLALISGQILISPISDSGYLSFIKIFFYALIFLLSMDTSNTKNLGLTIVGLGLIDGLFLIVRYSAHGSVGNYLGGNAAYGASLASIALIYLWMAQPFRAPIRLALVGFFMATVLLLHSRTALMALLPAFIYLFKHRKPERWIILLSILAIFLSLSTFQGFLRYNDNTPLLSNPDYGGRISIWMSALKAAAERPFFGFGIGNFDIAYNATKLPQGTVLRFEKMTAFAHNDYLQVLVETGVVGLIIFLAFIFLTFWKSRRPDTPDWLRYSFYFFLLAALVNFNFYSTFNGILISAVVGSIWGYNKGGETIPLKAPFLYIGTAMLLLFLLVRGTSDVLFHHGREKAALVLWPKNTEARIRLSDRYLEEDDYENGREELIKAEAVVPKDPYIKERLARLYRTRELFNISKSIEKYSQAIELMPTHAPFWIEKGRLLLATKEVRSAQQCFRQARDLEPNAPLPWFMEGKLYQQMGKKQVAERYFRMCFNLQEKFKNFTPNSNYARALFSVEPSLTQ